jgi:uncharacterized Zn-finger protein
VARTQPEVVVPTTITLLPPQEQGSPPKDHPHIHINMAEADTILCPYCGTRFRFDPRLTPLDADPPHSFFADHNAAWAQPRRRTGPIAFTRFGRISPR